MEKPEKSEYHPCDREKGFCPPLAERLKQIGPGPGLFALYVTNGANLTLKQIQKLNIRPVGVYYLSGLTRKSGVMIVHCPFCGRRIDWWNKHEEEIDDKQRN
jgi:hypothetical protein